MTLRELQRLTLEQLAAAQAQPGQYTILRDTMDAQSAVFAEQEARFTEFYAGAAAEMVGFTELLDVLDAPKHRGAFRALAELGLAVAYGRAMHLVDSVTWGKRGRDFEAECIELLRAAGLETVVP